MEFMPVRREFYRELAELGDKKAVALFNLVEVVIFGYFQSRRDGQDAEIVAALQALRRTGDTRPRDRLRLTLFRYGLSIATVPRWAYRLCAGLPS